VVATSTQHGDILEPYNCHGNCSRPRDLSRAQQTLGTASPAPHLATFAYYTGVTTSCAHCDSISNRVYNNWRKALGGAAVAELTSIALAPTPNLAIHERTGMVVPYAHGSWGCSKSGCREGKSSEDDPHCEHGDSGT
jgi:hypothetical protein